MLSASLTTEGASPVFISASLSSQYTGASTLQTVVTIYRDGVDIYSSSYTAQGSGFGFPRTPWAGNFTDYPSAGAHTYTIGITNTSNVEKRSMFIMQVKK